MTERRFTAAELAILARAREDSLRVYAELARSPGINAALEAARQLASSPLLDAARAANRQLVTESNRLAGVLASFSKVPDHWSEHLTQIASLGETALATRLALEEQFSAISLKSSIAEIALAGVDWSRLTAQFRIPESITLALPERYLDMTTSYRSLLESIAAPTLGALSFPPVVSQYPPVEFFAGATVVEFLTVETPDIATEEQELRDALADETAAELPVALERLDGELVAMWRGATAALSSSNPDRARHFATSLRELFTHVLHRLAPDTDVRSWSATPEHYHDGRPTRRARLLYVCRNISHPPFDDFVDKDIAAVLKVLELFQEGTHAVGAGYSDAQLVAMRVRMESALRFLLEIAES